MTSSHSRLRVAMIGQKGIPASWGGVERHVEELSARLVEKGHAVTVYNRPGYSSLRQDTYRGVRLVNQWTPRGRGVEAFAHSTLSAFRCLADAYDIVHFHAVGPGLASPIPRYLSKAAVVQTIHGLDADRAKWGKGAQNLLNMATWMSARVPDEVVTVSLALTSHYQAVYGTQTTYVPNGVVPAREVSADVLGARFGLEPGTYVLFVGRLVPEKCPDVLLRAFAALNTDLRLVIVGGSSDTDSYTREINALAASDPRVIMTGYAFGDDLAALYTHARLFALPSLLEGLPLTLLEACSYGLPVVASAIPPHLEVIGTPGPGARTARPGDVGDLVTALQLALGNAELEQAGAQDLRARVLAHYNWDSVTNLVEAVYREAADGNAQRRLRVPAIPRQRPTTTLVAPRVLDLTGDDRSARSTTPGGAARTPGTSGLQHGRPQQAAQSIGGASQ